MAEQKIKSFRDLRAWQRGHALVLETYSATKTFPSSEVFCLTSQMRRSALSVTSNIAEGFSRRTSKEKVQFYFVALGSLTELQNQLTVANDVGYIANEKFQFFGDLTTQVHKLINGLIKYSRSQILST